jgi:DNA polymerase-1
MFRFDIKGGHGLGTWGERLGIPKPVVTDFNTVGIDTIVHRCVEDTKINKALWKKLEKSVDSMTYKKAVELEHKFEFVCLDMEVNGFPFDIDLCRQTKAEIEQQLEEVDLAIKAAFKPRYVLIKEITPKETKKGTLSLTDFRWMKDDVVDLSMYSPNSPFSLVSFEEFNPASPKQIVERLNEAGWKPHEKTKGHIVCERELKRERKPDKRKELQERLEQYRVSGWSVNEANLATLPADAPEGARKLAERILLASRRSVLTEWENAYRELSGCVHGRFNGIGAWTHRMSHQAPNQGNIPSDPDLKDEENPTGYEKLQLKYGVDLRKMWRAPKGKRLVGTDADQIQLRVFAHYIEDEDFTLALVQGDKKLGTDVHTLNAIKLGFGPERRPVAKTFIYGFLLGAGVDKVAEILYTSNKVAREKVDDFVESYPGLKYLKQKIIPKDGERGYFEGLDGRLVPVPSEHHVLAGYLQNGESIIMKTANLLWRERARKEKLWFKQVDLVHDEFQTLCNDDDTEAELLAQYQREALAKAGELLNLKCPVVGDSKIGYDWKSTH